MQAVDVAALEGPDILGEELQPRPLVPRRFQIGDDLEGFVAVLDQSEVVFAVVDEVLLDGGGPNRLAVAVDQGPRRFRGDDVLAGDAAGGKAGEQRQPGVTHHGSLRPEGQADHHLCKERKREIAAPPRRVKSGRRPPEGIR
jgi:hypothetical protein